MTDAFSRLKAALSDRYTIERELGAGGMATVYLAEDLKLHRKVAVKVLRPELAAALGPDRFLQEIDIAAKLNHPHILGLHDCGEADGFLYYVMPYVEGQSLRDKLAKEGELPISEAVRILRDVVDALSHAHKHNVVHRDIKPDNVMLTERHALVTDFGVAKAVSEATGRQKLTTEGVALGTPAYMAPEQAAADPHIDHRADIYAVGVVAYELLTGRTPFLGTTPQMILSAHLTDTPDPVSKYRESVPPALEQLVLKCLEKKAADRWRSAEELLPQLEALVTPSGGVTPTGTMPVSAAKRGWKVAAATGLIAAILAVILVVTLLPRGSGVALDPTQVVVAVFRNATGDPSFDQLGERAGHWITLGLQKTGVLTVTPWEMALPSSQFVQAELQAGRVRDVVRALAEETGAGTVISGVVYLEADSIEIQVEVTNAARGRSLGVVDPVIGPRQTQRELIGRLQQQVMGFLAVSFDDRLSASGVMGTPPTFEAYEAFTDALEHYGQFQYREALPHLRRASELDSTWVEPLVFQLFCLWNTGQRVQLDSILSVVERSDERISPYHAAWFDWYRARFDGDRERALTAIRRAVEVAPNSKAVYNLGLYLLGMNRPQEALELLRTLDPEHGAMRGIASLGSQLMHALRQVGKYDQVLEEANRWGQLFPDQILFLYYQPKAWALAHLGRINQLNDVLDDMVTVVQRSEWVPRVMYRCVQILRADGRATAATQVLERAIEWHETRSPVQAATQLNRRYMGRMLFLAERGNEAREIYDGLVDESPDNLSYRGYRAFIAASNGDTAQALTDAAWFESLNRPFLMGEHTYWRGVISCAVGEREDAVSLLRQAFEGGQSNTRLDVLNEVFASLRDYPPFQELMRPKG